MFSLIRHFKIALFLILAVSAQATAMTVYDVIQLSKKNYTDQDIIALIETTDSAFELKAGDVSRLVELGVSETVIQSMLKAVPAEPPVDSTAVAAITSLATDKLVNRILIDSQPLKEPGSGGHHHLVITLSDVRLLVLRDEGAYPTVTARAKAVADRLRAASAIIGDGQFQPVHMAGGDAVMFTVAGTNQPIIIISVSAQDASAYQRRSGRRVTPDLLAAYWSDLLSDYWSIALGGQPPDRLTTLHKGEALQELHHAMDKSIENYSDRLSVAFQLLPKQEQEHLSQLSVSVPSDFNSADKHGGEEP